MKKQKICEYCKKGIKNAHHSQKYHKKCSVIYRRKYINHYHKKYQPEYRKTDTSKSKQRDFQKKYTKENPEKVNAHKISNKLGRKDCCEFCKNKNCRLEKHHPNYKFPEVFMTLCSKCHRKIHL